MNKGVRLSINPDAHSAEGFRDIRFGVLAAQKGGLTKAFNLSSMSRMEIGEYLENRKSGLKG
jgi:DNA polymerase (family 10)